MITRTHTHITPHMATVTLTHTRQHWHSQGIALDWCYRRISMIVVLVQCISECQPDSEAIHTHTLTLV